MSEKTHRLAAPITASLDVLFTLVFFYALVHWRQATGPINKILLALILVIILIDWLSSRATYDIYTVSTLLFDLADVFVLVNLIPTVLPNGTALGYEPEFWLGLACLSALFAIWDFAQARRFSSRARQHKRLVRWGLAMTASIPFCLAVYAVLGPLSAVPEVAAWPAVQTGGQIVGVAFWVMILGIWLFQRLEPAVRTPQERVPSSRIQSEAEVKA